MKQQHFYVALAWLSYSASMIESWRTSEAAWRLSVDFMLMGCFFLAWAIYQGLMQGRR